MRTHNHLSDFRDRTHPMFGTDDSAGMNGVFVIPMDPHGRRRAMCIVSDATEIDVGWEHVSVRIGEKHNGKWRDHTPTWQDMCRIKELFWLPDECVVQFHPAQKDYVNMHPNVLHLWKQKKGEFPMPPKECV